MSSIRAPDMHDHCTPVLRLEGLRVEFTAPGNHAVAVAAVDMTIRRGEIVGLVGESGSGKSMTGLSVMRLVDPPGVVTAQRLDFNGVDLGSLTEAQMRALRGRKIAMIFQDPLMTLNPVLSIGTQMIEAITAHEDVSRQEAEKRCCDVLARVGIAEPARRLRSFPHEFSGGMRQRVAIAIALLHQPDLIIADEPTTALDVTIQAQILYEVEQLCRETGTAMLWITHDLGVVARIADRVCVMYAGRIVEDGPVATVLEHPSHPYTAGLIASIPGRQAKGTRLFQMPGTPMGSTTIEGCAFRPRCSRADQACATLPALDRVAVDHLARCVHPL
jgi:peptide/nickel transport system ATP-binding protein